MTLIILKITEQKKDECVNKIETNMNKKIEGCRNNKAPTINCRGFI